MKAALLLFLASLALSAAAADKPNFIFILCDDLGYGDLACLNPKGKIPTPNLDRLAREGVTFTDAHTSSSVCTPTRYGVMTGRYNWRSKLQKGVLGGLSPRLIEPGRLTVASMLQQQGYLCIHATPVAAGNDRQLFVILPRQPQHEAIFLLAGRTATSG